MNFMDPMPLYEERALPLSARRRCVRYASQLRDLGTKVAIVALVGSLMAGAGAATILKAMGSDIQLDVSIN